MRNYLVPTAIAAALVSAPAAAHDNMLYVGGDLGILLPRDGEIDVKDVNTGTEFNNAVDLQYNTGFGISGEVGYDFGMFKLEGELGYKHASFDAVDPSTDWITFLQNRAPPGVIIAPDDIHLDDGVDIISAMANGLVDIGPDDGFGGYLGGGIGIGWAKAYGESSSSFAWQFIAGVKYPISKSVDIGLKYRYFSMDGLDFVPGTDIHGTNYDLNLNGQFRTHDLSLNLTYGF